MDYKEIIHDIESSLHLISMSPIEKLVETIKTHCSDKWITDFEDRYLNFEKIEYAKR